ncbi:hypothetical protein PC117_g12853 [Phytophthora cactorum]|nr:hypothetical protein PC117_g12853 [Phytophthora cactorum]
MMGLVYVDDILVSTSDEQRKVKLFEDIDEGYRIKDQGLLIHYIGVEVVQTTEHITTKQSKYSREILEEFGYDNDHAVGTLMGVNARLAPLGEDESSDTIFLYHEAIGVLMYLAS